MNKEDIQEGCWHTVSGSITRWVDDAGKAWTTIRLGGRDRDGVGCGQRVDIETARLRKPGVLKRTLDIMALDLRRYDLV